MATVGKLWRRKETGAWMTYINGKPKTVAPATATEDQALLAYYVIKNQQGQATKEEEEKAEDFTISTLLGVYLKDGTEGMCEHGKANIRRVVNLFSETYGDRPLTALTPEDVRIWYKRQPGWNQTTQRNGLKMLTAAFNWLQKSKRLINSHPFGFVKKPRDRKRSKDVLISTEEYGKLLEIAQQPYRDIYEFLWETGCRPSECLGCMIEDVRAARREATLYWGKNERYGRVRDIPLSGRADEVVRARIGERTEGLLFPSAQGKQMRADVLYQQMRRDVEKIGINRAVFPYSFRHSFCARKLLSGVPINVVAAWMGDKVHVVEAHYSHCIELANQTLHMLDLPERKLVV